MWNLEKSIESNENKEKFMKSMCSAFVGSHTSYCNVEIETNNHSFQ